MSDVKNIKSRSPKNIFPKIKFYIDCIIENSERYKKTGDMHSILLNDLDHIHGLANDAKEAIIKWEKDYERR